MTNATGSVPRALAVRHGAGQRRPGAAPQALPHPGRRLRSTARRVHAIVLPHAMAFGAQAAPRSTHRIACALGIAQGGSAPAGLFDLLRDNGARVALKDIGMKAADLDRAAAIAISNPYWNPRRLLSLYPRNQSHSISWRALKLARQSKKVAKPRPWKDRNG